MYTTRVRMSVLVSVSCLSVFLDHLGIATVDIEFQQDQEAEYGVCESKKTLEVVVWVLRVMTAAVQWRNIPSHVVFFLRFPRLDFAPGLKRELPVAN